MGTNDHDHHGKLTPQFSMYIIIFKDTLQNRTFQMAMMIPYVLTVWNFLSFTVSICLVLQLKFFFVHNMR